VDAYLPEEYVGDAVQRTTLYQKLARLESPPAVAEMAAELEDRFGKPPDPARMLLRTVEARGACRRLGLRRAEIRENALLLTFSEKHLPPREDLSALAGRVRLSARFLYGGDGEPLQLRVDLNPQRRGDAEALTARAVETLREMIGEAGKDGGEGNP
jgi:transcription-repair coupling factor (superfamily II helicase)